MAMKRQIAEFELSDGTSHEVRLLLADKIRAERTRKARNWGENDMAMTTLMVWSAAVRAGHYQGSFEEFQGTPEEPGDCVDLFVDQRERDEEDPTQPTSQTA